jgi:Spy/CpxP family protein refolding chaperone
MVRLIGFLCAALLFASAPARAAGDCAADQRPGVQPQQNKDKAQPGQPPSGREGRKKFWVDPELRAELGITDQQSAALEKEWQRTLTLRRDLNDRLDKADAILQKMLLDAADEAAVVAQLDKVEAARSEANKARVLLLYRMNKLLSQDQRAKLDAKMKAMHERDGRRGGGSR